MGTGHRRRPHPPAGRAAATWRPILPALIVAAIAAAIYLPTVEFGYTGWDDSAYIPDNPQMRDLSGLVGIWASGESEQYYPLTFSSYWIEYRLWGDRAGPYHLVNLLLHALNSGLVVLLLFRLSVSRAASCVAALLFALHPLQVMSVAWIAERKNVLSGLFCLLAYLAWIRFRRNDSSRAYLGATLLFVAAVLSKTVALTLVAPLLVLDCAVFRRSLRDGLVRVMPLALIGVLLAIVTVRFEESFFDPVVMERLPGFAARILIAAAAPWFYLFKTVWPAGLSPMYPLWNVRVASLSWWLAPAAWIALAALVWRARLRIDPRILWGAVHFLAILGPSLGVIPFGNLAVTHVSDHFLYVALIGLFAALAVGLDLLAQRAPAYRAASLVVAAAAVFGCAAVTWGYLPTFRDAESMWTRVLKTDPRSYPACVGLARVREEQGRLDQAAALFRRAIEITPQYPETRVDLAEVLLRMGNAGEAEEILRDVLVTHPGHARAHVRLASLLLRVPDHDAASFHFRRAIDEAPEDPLAHLGLATCLRAWGEGAAAVDAIRAGLAHAPRELRLNNMLARLLATSTEPAARDGQRSVELAERLCSETGYENPGLLDTLAAAYAEAGRFDDAEAAATRAARAAEATGDTRSASTYRDRALQYRAGRPLREGGHVPARGRAEPG